MDDIFEAALDKMLVSADGDSRRVLRALLIENVRLQVELDRRTAGMPAIDRGHGRKSVLDANARLSAPRRKYFMKPGSCAKSALTKCE